MKCSIVTALVAVVFIFLIAGCDEVVTEYSGELTENGVVSELLYSPSRHETSIDTLGYDDSVVDINQGNIGKNTITQVQVGKLRVNSTTIPEQFGVVIKCQHGKLTTMKKRMYDRFINKEGSAVTITYREVYRATYKNENNERKLLDRVLVDRDLLDVTLK
ncbi:hypothetical protein HY967_00270 [Candidatus Jorgensenbacteria bacterium]|nr:hypothetical protein [Candidatus Jorgensenbacteria bacterium]